MTLILIVLPPPLECWDYRKESSHPVYAVLGIKPGSLCVLGKHFTNCTTSMALKLFVFCNQIIFSVRAESLLHTVKEKKKHCNSWHKIPWDVSPGVCWHGTGSWHVQSREQVVRSDPRRQWRQWSAKQLSIGSLSLFSSIAGWRSYGDIHDSLVSAWSMHM